MCAFFFAANIEQLLRHSKSFGPSAPIAYATSVSPPNEAAARPGRWSWVLDESGARQGRRCWVANDAAAWPGRSSSKSPRTPSKHKHLIHRQLNFIAVLGEHNLRSSSTPSTVNCLVIRTLHFVSVRGDFLEGHSYASRCHFSLCSSTKTPFLCLKGRLARQGYHYAIMNDYLAPENDYLALVNGYHVPGNVIP